MWQDRAMFGRFRLRERILCVTEPTLERVVALDWVHSVPGLPEGVVGLIDANDMVLPLLSVSAVLGDEPESEVQSEPIEQRIAVICHRENERFAIPVDELLELVDGLPSGDDAEGEPFSSDEIWKRIAAWNEERA